MCYPQDVVNCTRYVVKPSSTSGWINQVDGREYGPYLSRDIALRLAIADVLCRRKAGCPLRLVVENSQGSICAERCLCEKFWC